MAWANCTSSGTPLARDDDTAERARDLQGRLIHSFVIKIWREETHRGERPQWRGHITHVSTNERRYFKSLADIVDFIAIYLEDMGIRMGLRWTVKQWIKKSRHIEQ